MFLGSCWFFPSCEIMPFHAKSCPFSQNHAISGHGLAWIFPPTLVEFPGEGRVQFLFVCLRCPHSTDLSVAASVCHGGVSQTLPSATTGWPCDEAAGRNTLRPQCLRAQADIFMGFSKLWQYLGLVSTVAMYWEE